MTSLRFLLPSMLALALSACGGSSDELNQDDAALLEGAAPVEETPATAPDAGPEPVVVEEVVLANDVVAVGSAVGADGAISAKKSTYLPGDTVHAAVSLAGHPAGKEAAIYWFSSNGVSIKGERKPIPAGAKFVNFSLDKASGMEPGSYTAQVDIDDTPVGMADFVVK